MGSRWSKCGDGELLRPQNPVPVKGRSNFRRTAVRFAGATHSSGRSPAEANKILASEGEAAFKPVLNGRDFSGWEGPLDNYEIVDGAVRCKGTQGRHDLHRQGIRRLCGPP